MPPSSLALAVLRRTPILRRERLKGFEVILSNSSTWLPAAAEDDGSALGGEAAGEAEAWGEGGGRASGRSPAGVSCGSTEHFTPGAETVVLCRGRARFVSVAVYGAHRFLSLCEVEVWSEVSEEVSSEAVVTLADGYSLAQVAPFVLSLRQTGFRGGIHVFMSSTHSLCPYEEQDDPQCEAVALRFLEAAGVVLEDWPPGLGRLNTGWQTVPYATDRLRLELFGGFAARARQRGIERVLLSDSRDVVFQSNPFLEYRKPDAAVGRDAGREDRGAADSGSRLGAEGRGLPEHELHLFAETITLDETGHNRDWLEACWGGEDSGSATHGEELGAGSMPGGGGGERAGGWGGVRGAWRDKVAGKAVVCSGVVMGSPEAVEAYSSVLLNLFSESFLASGARCLVGDQAMLNYAFYHGLLPSGTKLWPNGLVVWHLGTVGAQVPKIACIDGACGYAITEKGRVPAVLHQYPALPAMAAVILHRIVTRERRGASRDTPAREGHHGDFPPSSEIDFSVVELMGAIFPTVDAESIDLLTSRAIDSMITRAQSHSA